MRGLVVWWRKASPAKQQYKTIIELRKPLYDYLFQRAGLPLKSCCVYTTEAEPPAVAATAHIHTCHNLIIFMMDATIWNIVVANGG